MSIANIITTTDECRLIARTLLHLDYAAADDVEYVDRMMEALDAGTGLFSAGYIAAQPTPLTINKFRADLSARTMDCLPFPAGVYISNHDYV